MIDELRILQQERAASNNFIIIRRRFYNWNHRAIPVCNYLLYSISIGNFFCCFLRYFNRMFLSDSLCRTAQLYRNVLVAFQEFFGTPKSVIAPGNGKE